MPAIEPITLTGRIVRLVPLTLEHCDELIDAVRDGELWRLWYTSAPRPEAMQSEIERRLSMQTAGTLIPFAVIDVPSGRAVGMTSYTNLDRVSQRVEIGSTWYAQRVQRTGLNTEAKLLLLTHAFETLGCIAVEFRTHFMNQQSRRAIERLGAKLDGILRNHTVKDGLLRDTCVYSILPSEWPTVKAHLEWQIVRPRHTDGDGKRRYEG